MALTLRMQTFIILCHLATEILTFNHTTAKEQCKGHGGLASGGHFINNNGRNMDVHSTLNEGESAWISGNVMFSKFVSWHGCFDIKDTLNLWKDNLTENDIFNCLGLCSKQQDTLFIGLQKKVCYCMEREDLQHLVAKPHTECEMQLIEPYVSNKNNELSSTETTTHVYTIINDKVLFWKPDLPVARSQCVYVKYTGTRTIYVTESCFTQTQGFICVNSTSTTLRETCSSFYPALSVQDPAFCMVNKPSSWLTSFYECMNYSGQLAHTIYPRVTEYIKPDAAYWTGIFRSFDIEHEGFTMQNTVCLSIKKIYDKLVFDPADCSASKKYICEDGVSENIDSTTLQTTSSQKESESEQKSSSLTTTVSKTDAVSSVSYLSKPTLPTTMLSKGNETEDGETIPTSIYIAIGVVLPLLFALVLTCLILRKRRRKRNIRERGPISKDDHKTPASETDIKARSAAVSHSVSQSQVLIHQHTEATEECEYATPNKAPIQHNVPECEYDRALFCAPGKLTNNTASAVPADDNVYGIHSGIKHCDETDEYDHLHTVGTKQIAMSVDVIYNTMSEESVNYNMLRSESKGTSADQTVKRRPQLEKTCASDDKLYKY